MQDQLNELVQESGQDAVVNNPDVPNEQNAAVLQEASSSIMNGLQNVAQQGGPGALKSMFEAVQNGDNSHPAVQQVTDNYSNNLMEKFGLSSGVAKTVAMSMIPVVLGKLMNRSQNAPAGSGFSIGNILGSIMGGGSGGGLGSLLGGAAAQPQVASAPAAGGGSLLDTLGAQFGLDKNGDGHTDLKDLLGMFGA